MSLARIVEISVRRRGVVLTIWAARVRRRPDVGQAALDRRGPRRHQHAGFDPDQRARAGAAGGRAVPDLPDRDRDERRAARRGDPVDQPHGGVGGDGRLPGGGRHLVRAPDGQRAAEAGRKRHPARLRLAGAGPGVDGAGRDLRVLSGVEEAHADGAAHHARLAGGHQAALRPRRRRGQRHGGRGQAVSGRARPQAAGGLPAVAQRRPGRSWRRTTRRSAAATSRRTASRSSSAPTGSSTPSRTSRTRSSRRTPTARRC